MGIIAIGRFSLEFLCSIGILLVFLFFVEANAGAYSDSAHGDTGYGVKRAGMASNYVRGNCGHCHKQHASGQDGLLFETNFSGQMFNPYTADNNLCFKCHRATGAVQVEGGITNENYSATFGGANAVTSGILEAFNQNSYHNLYDLQRYITGASGTKSFSSFSSWYNPCSGCHNAHLVRANKHSVGEPSETVMSKPSDHEDLWGDGGTAELMTDYGTGYQPPLYQGSTTLLEPDGLSTSATIQAAKTPNYNAFCTDCHNSSNLIYSSELGRNLRTFDWSSEVHGQDSAANMGMVEMVSPYSDTGLGRYVLSCMDCHEPHGSSNIYLIRRNVNAGSVSLPAGSSDWGNLCSRCHVAISDLKGFHHKIRGDFPDCDACHTGGTRSGVMVDCTECHYHGSSAGGYKTF